MDSKAFFYAMALTGCSFASTLWAQEEPSSAAAALANIESKRQVLYNHLEKAKEVSFKVFRCIDKKIEIVERLQAVAKRTASRKLKKAQTAGNQEEIREFLQRIGAANKDVDQQTDLARRCWCADEDLVQQSSVVKIKEESIAVGQLCGNERLEKTVVTLKAPAESEVLETDGEKSGAEENYGFPEIPSASPFR